MLSIARICDLDLRKRGRIRGAGKILVDATLKEVFVRRGAAEQGHGRTKFYLVDRAEDVACDLGLRVERELRAFPEPRAENAVGKIGFRLVQRRDRETDRHGALSEARDLGKNEPHPMALLPPDLQLLANALVDRRLCVDEPVEIKRVRYLRLLKPPRRSKAAPNSRCARLEQRAFDLNRDRHCDRGASPGAQYGCISTPVAPRDDDSVYKLPALAPFWVVRAARRRLERSVFLAHSLDLRPHGFVSECAKRQPERRMLPFNLGDDRFGRADRVPRLISAVALDLAPAPDRRLRVGVD